MNCIQYLIIELNILMEIPFDLTFLRHFGRIKKF